MENSFSTYKKTNLITIVIFFLTFIIAIWNIGISIYLLGGFTLIKGLKFFKNNRFVSTQFHTNIVEVILLIIIAFEFISFYFSAYRPNSFKYLLFISFIGLFYLFFKIKSNPNKENDFELLGIGGYGVVVSVLTLFFFLIFHFNITYEGFKDITNFRNLYHPFSQLSNDWNTVLLCFVPFPVLFFIKYRNHKKYRLWAIAALVPILFGIIVSFSRGAYLALFMFFAVLGFLLLIYKIFSLKKLLFSSGLLLLITIGLVAAVHKPFFTTVSFFETTSQKRSVEGRISIWSNALDIVKAYPALGVGANNFTLYYNKYKDRSEDSFFTGRVSNSFLQLLVEKGIIGFTLYGALLVVYFFILHKRICQSADSTGKAIYIVFGAAMIALLVRELTFSSVFQHDGVFMLFSFFLIYPIYDYSQWNLSFHKKTVKRILLPLFVVFVGGLGFIFVYQIRLSVAERNNEYFVKHYNRAEYKKALSNIKKACAYNPRNAQYHAYHALALLHNQNSFNSADSIISCLFTLDDTAKKTVKQAIDFYKTALSLNPVDDGYHHNIAWLYKYLNKDQKAWFHLKKSLEIDPNIALYHISLGIFNESRQRMEVAKREYFNAIRLSPEIIESQFFHDLLTRIPENKSTVINTCINDIEKIVASDNSFILKARLAKLYCALNMPGADSLLKEVSNHLPNLNRPWLYKGHKALEQQDTITAKNYYLRAGLLDGSDVLPKYYLGKLFDAQSNMQEAVLYYKHALRNLVLQYSQHSFKSSGIYHNCKTVGNDIFPFYLFRYCKPAIPTYTLSKKIANYYKEIDNQQYMFYDSVANQFIPINKMLNKLPTSF